MTIIEKEFVDTDGNHTLVFRVKSACCDDRYTVWVTDGGHNYFDLEKLEPVSAGMRISIDRERARLQKERS